MADVMTDVSAAWLAEQIAGVRAGDIHRDLTRLIDAGTIPRGAKLPTVRELAGALGISVGSVSDAWQNLRRDGLVETRRRGGTTVAVPDAAAWSAGSGQPVDLVRAGADPALLPDLAAVLTDVLAQGPPPPSRDLITPGLRRAAQHTWPYPLDDVVAVPGAHAGMHLAVSALLTPGATIAVEDPTCIRDVGIYRAAGARVITVESDAAGPLPESLAAAVAEGPELFAFQPVASIPLGFTLTSERRDALAAVLASAPRPVWVLEEDPAGPLRSGASLGTLLPDRTVRVVQLTLALGSAVQTALVGGPRDAVRAIARLQRAQGNRASPLLQDAVGRLLERPATTELMARAAKTYARREAALREALALEGVEVTSAPGGFFVWIPVPDEAEAIVGLAERGVVASPGSRSMLDRDGPGAIRIATTRLPDDAAQVAHLASLIASGVRARGQDEDE